MAQQRAEKKAARKAALQFCPPTVTRYGRVTRPTRITAADYESDSHKQVQRLLSLADGYVSNADYILAYSDQESGTTPVSTHADISTMTYGQAMKSQFKSKWQQSVDTELQSLAQQHVFTEMECPTGVKPLIARWLFKIKHDEHNMPVKFKARLVVQGFKQQYGVDYTETFAPVAKAKSIRMLLSLVVVKNMELKQLDFDTAFLNASLSEDVYIVVPLGYGGSAGTGGSGTGNTVLKLNKALYGLKQAPHEWNRDVNAFIVNVLGYTRCDADQCIYVKVTGTHVCLHLFVQLHRNNVCTDEMLTTILIRNFKQCIYTFFPPIRMKFGSGLKKFHTAPVCVITQSKISTSQGRIAPICISSQLYCTSTATNYS